MAVRREVEPVLRLCSCLTADEAAFTAAQEELVERFGPVALVSEPFAFELTGYYEKEMGPGLTRTWLCFARLFGAETLPRFRIATERIERTLSERGRRRVNLDPGYLDFGKLVLASLKPAPDKVYMGHGVWAHTCLRYGSGEFTAPDHSFPDFHDGRFEPFLLRARGFYRRRLRGQAGATASSTASWDNERSFDASPRGTRSDGGSPSVTDDAFPRCDIDARNLVFRLQRTFPAELNHIDPVVAQVLSAAEDAGYEPEKRYKMESALREALANAIIHGAEQDPEKHVQLCAACDADQGIVLVVRDPGTGFDPEEIPNPVVGQNVYAEHGRGIFLINLMMDEVWFQRGGTEIWMRTR
jgi:anti-sigma regulatory factor (Ser/Thr protein kinase)